ncbi:MAG TPA: ABC-F family ATP-binding cassette domain-containing protein [Oligoflexia bacterium]|nr:ABC-F family ATP-binding cassette domain-containing protein [Oligoflexia bacterium]HMR24264.1 ABC-F family ATP-binding cassette domain-containing protein [Oligoflexia bacterium]
MSSPLLSVNQLSQAHGVKKLFKDLSFAIQPQDRIGLLGPNGAGKSTLLNIIAGQLKADSGQVIYSQNLKFGYLDQIPTFKHETIEEELLAVLEDAFDKRQRSMAEELISRLGLDTGSFNRHAELKTLSGGQQKRVALARELLKQPDLLILDEPTNHLDIESLLWLEDYLEQQKNLTLLCVSHDRLFLQNVCHTIFDLDPKYKDGLLKIDGSYDHYLQHKENILQTQESLESSQANVLRRETEWLQQGAKARTTKAKARIENVYKLKTEVEALRALNKKRDLSIEFSVNEKLPKKLIEAKKISKAYADKTLFKNFDLNLMAGSRIALLGKNGVGKTTLIRCLLGEENVDAGHIERAENLFANYIDQARAGLELEKSLIENLDSQGGHVFVNGTPWFIDAYLNRFNFKKEQFNMPVKALSGGEKARLMLAKLMLKPSPIIVLDEPTNDLDIETLDVLRDALKSYTGAVILVTHDRLFMEQVCDSIIAFTEKNDLLNDEEGELIRFESYLQWQDWKNERKKQEQAKLEQLKQTQKKKSSNVLKMSYKESYELEHIESHIQEKEEQLEAVKREITSEAVVSNPEKLIELSKQLNALENEVETMYQRWAELDEKQKLCMK